MPKPSSLSERPIVTPPAKIDQSVVTATSWEEIQAAAEKAKRNILSSLDAVLDCGRLLIQKQREEGMQRGGDRKSDDFASGYHYRISFEALVRSHTSISVRTAFNWMRIASIYQALINLSEGREFYDGVTIYKPTKNISRLAGELLQAIRSGEICTSQIPSQWAGMIGEASRLDDGKSRTCINYVELFEKSYKSIKTAFSRWDNLSLPQKAEVQKLWQELNSIVPEDLR